MAKTLTYSEVKELCEERKITLASLASYIGMTTQGLKPSLDNGKMSIERAALLCRLLGITPNRFFGWLDALPPHTEYNNTQYGMMNNQNIEQGIEVLHEQLKKKDEHIDKLLSLLSAQNPN